LASGTLELFFQHPAELRCQRELADDAVDIGLPLERGDALAPDSGDRASADATGAIDDARQERQHAIGAQRLSGDCSSRIWRRRERDIDL
jgi:hypothetical protein